MRTYLVCLLAIIASIGAARAEPDQRSVADLRRELEEILASDQALRRDARKLEEEQGVDSPALKELWAKQRENDAKNIARVQEILEKHGWPDRKTYGPLAGTAVFLVIQHADLEVQKKYLPIVREAAEKGNTQWSSVALLEDRILKPGHRETLVNWLAHLGDRSAELAQAMAEGGVLAEAVFLERSERGDHLVIYTRAHDLKAGLEALSQSKLPLVQEFNQLLAEGVDMKHATALELIYHTP